MPIFVPGYLCECKLRCKGEVKKYTLAKNSCYQTNKLITRNQFPRNSKTTICRKSTALVIVWVRGLISLTFKLDHISCFPKKKNISEKNIHGKPRLL